MRSADDERAERVVDVWGENPVAFVAETGEKAKDGTESGHFRQGAFL